MKEAVIITKKGIIKRFCLQEIRIMGRQAKGIKGITLDDGDEVIAMNIVDESARPKDEENSSRFNQKVELKDKQN